MLYLLVILCVVLVVWRWSKQQDPTEPPELAGKLPLVGHALMLLGDSVDFFNAVIKLSDKASEMGGVMITFLGPWKYYFITDPEDAFAVSSACSQKVYVYNFAKSLLGNGLINADVPTWTKHRRLLSPAFSQLVLDGFIDIFNAQAQSLVEKFSEEVGKPFDHEPHVKINSLESLFATSLGANPEEYGNIKKVYLPLLDEYLHICNLRGQTVWYHYDFLFNLSTWKKKQDDLVKNLNDFTDWVIQKNISRMKNHDFSENSTGKLRPFIDLIMETAKDNPSLTEEHIRDETSTIISSGHETSATAMTYILTVIGSYPDAQEKAYQEILQVLGDSDRYIYKEDLSKLVYVEAIMKEVLRLYPIAPIMARHLDKDVKLRNNTLKSGNGCILSAYGILRHPSWGPDANTFRPERWLEDSLPDPRYYAAFGLGRRNCIAKAYAMMSAKTVIAHVLRRYTITSDISKVVNKMNVFSRPVSGHHIALKFRH